MIYGNLGLKGCMKQYKGMSIRGKIDRLYTELKWAWQRAWRGYDDREVWCIDGSIRDRLIVLLQDYKNSYHCLWWCPDEYDWSQVCEKDKISDRYLFSEEQINVIIDILIFHLKMSDEDYCEKILYGSNCYDDDYKVGDRTNDDYIRIADIRKQNQDAAFDLLKILWNQLWD